MNKIIPLLVLVLSFCSTTNTLSGTKKRTKPTMKKAFIETPSLSDWRSDGLVIDSTAFNSAEEYQEYLDNIDSVRTSYIKITKARKELKTLKVRRDMLLIKLDLFKSVLEQSSNKSKRIKLKRTKIERRDPT